MTTPPTTSDEVVSQEHSLVEIDTNSELRAVVFSANGEHLVSGGTDGIRVWRVEDGREVRVPLHAQRVRCLAVSKDGGWIAAGTYSGVILWDARTYELVFKHDEPFLNGVDFSPDSTRFVIGSLNRMASVWDIAARRRIVGPLLHKDIVTATKFSPDGTRIATATPSSVRVYNSNDGNLLVDITVPATGANSPWFNNGLLWSNQSLFVVSDSTIRQFVASSETSQWQVLDSNDSSCIALPPQHAEYIAHATKRTVTIWDTSSHSQLGLIEHPQDIHSIAFSPDASFLAIAGGHGKITFNSLRRFNNLIPLSRLHPTFREPDIQIDGAALDFWSRDQLENADTSLTATITASRDPNHHALASRALIRTRLRDWDAALRDAQQSIEIQPSVAGYVAKSRALVGKGEKCDGYRACDIAFERFHSTHVSFILLIKAIIIFMAGDHVDAISRLDDLIATVQFNSICYIVQAYMHFLLGKSHVDQRDYEHAIQSFERAQAQMRSHTSRTLFVVSLISGWKFDDLGISIQKHLCEALYAASRINEAGESLLKMISALTDETCVSPWLPDFMQRWFFTPESCDAPSAVPLLKVWTKVKLTNGSWKSALSAAASFSVPKSTVYLCICERLETLGQITSAAECFHQMMSEMGGVSSPIDGQWEWVPDFKRRFCKSLEGRGDAKMDAQRYDEAISEYSAALALDPASPQDLLIKRSKAYVAGGHWEDALNDADEVIKLEPSSPWGYERKHAALHKGADYDGAICAFQTMLSKMVHSPDPETREQSHSYVKLEETKKEIHKAIKDALKQSPRILINTTTGRLLDKSQQASMFETLTVYKEMISSMTMDIDLGRIEQEVAQYYRYATFSHKWGDNEPLYDKVIHIVVYDLEKSTAHDKLRTFCKIVQDAGFNWAWSDTCCINKADHFVLQEALVAMFRWYENSALTIVFLHDVHSPSRRGDLVRSIWNTRAWTFQEYHASKVVRFYTADWKPYPNLDIPNHKESPEIISEMEEATGVPAQTLTSLSPGTDDIREKLCLASQRETTLVEDAAYSLFGIFRASLSIVYGEGDKALGRLLAHLLTSSGDASILAWTGESGSFNSCLPANITVFQHLATTHIPQAINDAEMDKLVLRIQPSSLNFTHAQKLYDHLIGLPIPMSAENRMKLPCIIFKLGPLSSKSKHVFQAKTIALGKVEIRTTEDLSRLGSLYLVYPWINFLLDQQPVGSGLDSAPEGSIDDHSPFFNTFPPSRTFSDPKPPTIKPARTLTSLWSFGGRSTPPPDTRSLLPPSSISQIDKRMRVLRFVVRLRQPFGALLFTPTRQNVPEYKRVASDSAITVQVQEDAPLNVLMENARTLDVL